MGKLDNNNNNFNNNNNNNKIKKKKNQKKNERKRKHSSNNKSYKGLSFKHAHYYTFRYLFWGEKEAISKTLFQRLNDTVLQKCFQRNYQIFKLNLNGSSDLNLFLIFCITTYCN